MYTMTESGSEMPALKKYKLQPRDVTEQTTYNPLKDKIAECM